MLFKTLTFLLTLFAHIALMTCICSALRHVKSGHNDPAHFQVIIKLNYIFIVVL